MSKLSTVQQKKNTVRALFEKMAPEFQRALPKHLSVERLIRIALNAVSKTPKLLDCSPESLCGAVLQAGQLGLECDGLMGQAYLIPYGKKATLQVGYKGLLQLARNTGEIASVQARVVHEKDSFSYQYGTDPKIEHTPYQGEDDAGPITHFYSVLSYKDGSFQFEVLTKAEVDAVMAKAQARDNGPWVTHYDEMGKKTALKRNLKLAPMQTEKSRDLQKAIALDELGEIGKMQHLDVPVIPETSTTEHESEEAETEPEPEKVEAGQGELL